MTLVGVLLGRRLVGRLSPHRRRLDPPSSIPRRRGLGRVRLASRWRGLRRQAARPGGCCLRLLLNLIALLYLAFGGCVLCFAGEALVCGFAIDGP